MCAHAAVHANCFGARYRENIGVGSAITAFPMASIGDREPRAPAAKSRSLLLRQFRLVEWIVPPIVVPLLLVILVIAAAALHV